MIIKARVRPSSKHFKIELKGSILEINLTQPSKNNKANEELVKELIKRFGSCKIVKGHKSRNKILEIPSTLNTLEKKIRL
jgi:uncharacterized protein (TIGR00251 family)